MNDGEKERYRNVSAEMEEYIAADSLNVLSDYLMHYYGKKVIILLDECDTPMQEAYMNRYWKVLHYEFNVARRKAEFDLKLTNLEVQAMFEQMIEGWFGGCHGVNNAFLRAMMADDKAVILEFKVQEEGERELSDTVEKALQQIRDRNYKAALIAKGIPEERIKAYGFAFCGKKVLIGGEDA